jgi:hypothetical protein
LAEAKIKSREMAMKWKTPVIIEINQRLRLRRGQVSSSFSDAGSSGEVTHA